MKTVRYFYLLLFVLLPTLLSAQSAPHYSVDASWPMELPDNMILGQVSGIAVSSDDHIWIVHRPKSIIESQMGQVLDPHISECCITAPSVIEFDQAGNFIQAWGGPQWDAGSQQWVHPDYDWPQNEHGIYVDDEDNVWLGGNGENDHIVTRFTRSGEHLMTIGLVGETGGSNDTQRLGRPADVAVDTENNEVYIADGYLNRRVAVFDSESGIYKRHWGAYGERPDDGPLPAYSPDLAPIRQFRGPVHNVLLGPDNLVYVSDRVGNRLQVFDRDGTFVEESILSPASLGNGTVWDMEVSNFDNQRWLFVVDGLNMTVRIVDIETLEIVDSIGRGGRQAGQFDWVHNIAIDSQGNIYTAEVNDGRRVQKFSRAP
jgi:DNA-binding beta-propeller fold protein YncE